MDSLLKRLRERKGDTTYDAARSIGIAQSQYFRIENESATASEDFAARIAAYIGVPVETIFNPSRYVVAAATAEQAAQ